MDDNKCWSAADCQIESNDSISLSGNQPKDKMVCQDTVMSLLIIKGLR